MSERRNNGEGERMKQCDIRPSNGGFGEWDCGERCTVTEDELDETLSENTVYELGVDTLPEDCEDIRGRIHYQPSRVFAVDCGEEPKNINGDMGTRWEYFGIDEE
jgi:hypothetical protein